MRVQGLIVRPPETTLVSRARAFLAAGSSAPVPLIEHVCQIPGAPRAVAEHMATALFSNHPEFERDGDGRWALAVWAHAVSEPAPRCGDVRHDRLCDLSYVVVDVETTGGRAIAGDRITEIAAVVVQGGEIREVYETLVNPERSIPPMISSLTNITWDMVKHKPRFAEITERLTSVLRGHVFTAHNATFDWNFVSAEITRATGARLAGRRLCTVRLSRRLLPQLRRRSLDSVAHYFGVEITARHRAGGDAVATAHVLTRLLGEACGRGYDTWHDLDTFLHPPPVRRKKKKPSRLPRPVDKDTTA